MLLLNSVIFSNIHLHHGFQGMICNDPFYFAHSISRIVVDPGIDNPLATCRQKTERMAPSSVPQFHWPLYLTPPAPLKLLVMDPICQMHLVHHFSLLSGQGAEEEKPWKSTFTTHPVLLSSTSVIRGLTIILSVKPEPYLPSRSFPSHTWSDCPFHAVIISSTNSTTSMPLLLPLNLVYHLPRHATGYPDTTTWHSTTHTTCDAGSDCSSVPSPGHQTILTYHHESGPLPGPLDNVCYQLR